MSWEIIGKATGGNYTVELKLGPYGGEPPVPLLKAVTENIEQNFERWTGHKLQTVVVTSAPIRGAGAGATG